MRIVLINPTEEACTDFDDNSFDVIYTFPADVAGVQEWADTAKANGAIENLEMLGE